MRSSIPPIMIDGPDRPHAFDNIPLRTRPDHADARCGNCRGHGAWNEMLHLDSFRCRLAVCHDCDGLGWVASDGSRTISDIAIMNGHPAWTLRRIPPPPVLVSERPARHSTSDRELKLEAA